MGELKDLVLLVGLTFQSLPDEWNPTHYEALGDLRDLVLLVGLTFQSLPDEWNPTHYEALNYPLSRQCL